MIFRSLLQSERLSQCEGQDSFGRKFDLVVSCKRTTNEAHTRAYEGTDSGTLPTTSDTSYQGASRSTTSCCGCSSAALSFFDGRDLLGFDQIVSALNGDLPQSKLQPGLTLYLTLRFGLQHRSNSICRFWNHNLISHRYSISHTGYKTI